MEIKSNKVETKKDKKRKENKIIAFLLFLIGLTMMLFAVASPMIHGLSAFVVFIIGMVIIETPYNQLTKDMG